MPTRRLCTEVYGALHTNISLIPVNPLVSETPSPPGTQASQRPIKMMMMMINPNPISTAFWCAMLCGTYGIRLNYGFTRFDNYIYASLGRSHHKLCVDSRRLNDRAPELCVFPHYDGAVKMRNEHDQRTARTGGARFPSVVSSLRETERNSTVKARIVLCCVASEKLSGIFRYAYWNVYIQEKPYEKYGAQRGLLSIHQVQRTKLTTKENTISYLKKPQSLRAGKVYSQSYFLPEPGCFGSEFRLYLLEVYFTTSGSH